MHWLALLFFLLNIADQVTTYIGIHHHGAKEMNPAMSWLIQGMGFGWATVVKLAIAAAVGPTLIYLAKRNPKRARTIQAELLIFCALGFLVVVNNILVIVRR